MKQPRMGRLVKFKPARTKPLAVLVWNDGRRKPVEFSGCIRYIQPWDRDDGRRIETTFVLDTESAGEDSPGWAYREAESEDVTAMSRESWAKFQYETYGPRPRFSCEDNMRYPGETEEEAKRRINIEKYGTPTPQSSKPEE